MYVTTYIVLWNIRLTRTNTFIRWSFIRDGQA